MPFEIKEPRSREEIEKSVESLEYSLDQSELFIHYLADDLEFYRRHDNCADIPALITQIRRECERWCNLHAHLENVKGMLE